MFSIFGLFVVVTTTVFCSEQIQTDDILVLTKNNFTTVVRDNEFVLVDFYAPWSGNCKKLSVEYAKVAKLLMDKNSTVKLANIDATQETELAEKNGVRGYPTVILFRNGSSIEYNGENWGKGLADDIIRWLLKKTGHPAKELKSISETKEFINSSNIVVAGFFKNRSSIEAQQFLAAATEVDDQSFGITSDDDIYKEYGAKDGTIIAFKKFDEEKVVFEGKITENNIKKFVSSNSLPLIIEFTFETPQVLFKGEIKNHLLLFLMKGQDHFEKITEAARSVAKPFKERILFIRVDVSKEDGRRLLEFFAIKKEEVPTARIIKVEDDVAKYKPQISDLSADGIRSFVQDFLDGKIKQQFLSQDLPSDWDERPVKILVGTNFDSVVFDPTKDVLVEFYAPWCPHCTLLAPILDRLGEHFQNNSNITIAKIDGTANELEHTKVVSFPTIKLYSKGDNRVVKYNGTRTFDGLKKFIESGGVEGASIIEETA